ncbi:hypothetical protein M406DRAFT_337691 [Cryphonectria parasitica EP155]|uniref:DC-UbP/UBTD2 N-terminal domain-containing protein n=1 Tax=Cryphonectria parasitica (strain ATCC 38755 / EP155) TaxID=660469 RepID=A0A9P4Y4G0_CRYP1|nr:uncharacterized protein M406DRAFT_337691 [Cryphonectria parasitica EP155]KAF3766747.1 hypothetical protein M406DRAFT_337691 [Cryphonectria parasitica EP155]
MGCCFSRPHGPNSPCPGAVQSGSARATEPSSPHSQALPPPALTQGSEDGSATTPRQRTRRRRPPLGQHINKPLRRQDWTSKDHPWSRTALDRERLDFFETRVDGRPEIWQALHAALRVLWDAEVDSDEHDPAMALATAQSILNAVDITLPTGNLADGAYDSLGHYYQLPAHIVSDPVNIVSTSQLDGVLDDGEDNLREAGDAAAENPDNDVAEMRREEKGKAVVDVRAQVLAVVRPSDGSGDLKLYLAKEETVRSVIRRIVEEPGFNNRSAHSIRLVLLGKILNESQPLAAQDWQPDLVLNAFIRDDPPK